MYSVQVNGQHFTIRALNAAQLERAQLMARQAAAHLTDQAFAALPVEQRYYRPFVLDEGVVERRSVLIPDSEADPLQRAIVHISATGGAPAEVL